MEKSDRSVLKRIITATVIIAATVGLLWHSYNSMFLKFITAAFGVFAVYEIFDATNTIEHEDWFVAMMITAFVVPFLDIPNFNIVLAIVFIVACIGAIIMMIWTHRFHFGSPVNAALISGALILFFKTIPEIRVLENGLFYLIAPLLICMITDTFAYFVGRKKGKHKLIQKISPNKTWEGAFAGLVAGVVFAMLYGVILHIFVDGVTVRFLYLLLYAVITSIIGQFGDLVFSTVKRIGKVKDFGTLLPGHGGILDRLDSHLFGLVFTFLFCSCGGMFFV